VTPRRPHHPAHVATPIFDQRADAMATVLDLSWRPLTVTELAWWAGAPRKTVENILRCGCPRHGGRFEQVGWTRVGRYRVRAGLWRLRTEGGS
jgi:hypothetical protein